MVDEDWCPPIAVLSPHPRLQIRLKLLFSQLRTQGKHEERHGAGEHEYDESNTAT
jgi:hypothetical protein